MNNDTTVINLGGEDKAIKFRRKELKLLEVMFKTKISKINFDNLGIDELVKMIHLGLLHEDSDLTLEHAEGLIDDSPTTFGEMVVAVMEAFSVSMGGPKAKELVTQAEEDCAEVDVEKKLLS